MREKKAVESLHREKDKFCSEVSQQVGVNLDSLDQVKDLIRRTYK